jgi:hypothetical protein
MRPRVRNAVIVVSVVVTAAFVGVVLLNSERNSAADRGRRLGRILQPSRSADLGGAVIGRPPGGEAVTLAEARATVHFPISLPTTTAANSQNLSDVWEANTDDAVDLNFDGSDVTVILRPAAYSDAVTRYGMFIQQDDATASLGQVDGSPALVITPNTDEPQTNPAWIAFDLNGVEVNVVSHVYGTSTLLGVADSIAGQTSCGSCARTTRSRGAGRRLGIRRRLGSVVGVMRVVGAPHPSRRLSHSGGAVVRAFTLSGLAVASEYLHGKATRFRLALAPGKYRVVATTISDAAGREEHCPATVLYVRAGRPVSVRVNAGCSAR